MPAFLFFSSCNTEAPSLLMCICWYCSRTEPSAFENWEWELGTINQHNIFVTFGSQSIKMTISVSILWTPCTCNLARTPWWCPLWSCWRCCWSCWWGLPRRAEQNNCDKKIRKKNKSPFLVNYHDWSRVCQPWPFCVPELWYIISEILSEIQTVITLWQTDPRDLSALMRVLSVSDLLLSFTNL